MINHGQRYGRRFFGKRRGWSAGGIFELPDNCFITNSKTYQPQNISHHA